MQSRDLPGKLKQRVRPCASFEDSFRVGNAKPTISLPFKSDERDPFSGDLNRDGLFNWADHNCEAAFIPTDLSGQANLINWECPTLNPLGPTSLFSVSLR